jgi:hypothetical protein
MLQPDVIPQSGQVARRRVASLLAVVALAAVLVGGFGHRGEHAVRNLIVPGAGLFEQAWWFGAGFLALFLVAGVAWVRWGVDWTLGAVVIASVVTSLIVAPGGHSENHDQVVRSAHEFPLVMLFLALWQWARNLPVIGNLRRPTRVHLDGLADLGRLDPVNRCRAVSVLALCGSPPRCLVETVDLTDAERRAQRIAFVARGRHGPGALQRDHAALRTAYAAVGNARHVEALVADGDRQASGVAASEPGWVRLVDGALAAAVLADRGHHDPARRWIAELDHGFAMTRGHRPSQRWTPLGMSVGRAADWEQALATAIAHTRGWIDAADWTSLRARVLGAAARGTENANDERLIAAGRLWLATVDDAEASRIVARPTVRHDPLACAIDALARTRSRGQEG